MSRTVVREIEFGSEWEQRIKLPRTGREDYAFVRVGLHRVALVGGWDNQSSTNLATVDVYDIRTGLWTDTYQMLQSRSRCAAVAVNDRLYIFGGYGGQSSKALASCEMIDLSDPAKDQRSSRVRAQHTLSTLGPPMAAGAAAVPQLPVPTLSPPPFSRLLLRMPVARYGCAAIVYGQRYIVVLGGYGGRKIGALWSVDMFDTVNMTWSELPDMSKRREDLTAVSSGPRIIVAGGQPRLYTLDTAEVLDMRTLRWRSLSDLNRGRYSLGGTMVSDDLMVVAGGYGFSDEALSTVEFYDSRTTLWSPLPALNYISGACRLLNMDDRLIAAGDREMEILAIRNIGDTRNAALDKRVFFRRVLDLSRAKDVMTELTSIGRSIHRLEHLQIYYTAVNTLASLGVLPSEDRNTIIRSALQRCAELCSSADHLAYYATAVDKAQDLGAIDEKTSTSLRKMASIVDHHDHSFCEDLMTTMLAFSRREDLLNDRIEAVYGVIQRVHLHVLAIKGDGSTVDSQRSDLHRRRRVDAAVCFCEAVLKISSLGVALSAMADSSPVGVESAVFDIICRIVDFGDMAHIRSVVGSVGAMKPNDLAAITKSLGLGYAQSGQDDGRLIRAVEDGDSLLLLGFVAATIRELFDCSAGSTPPPAVVERKSNTEATEAAESTLLPLTSVTIGGCTGPEFTPQLFGDDRRKGLFAAIFHGYIDDVKEVFADEPNVDVNQIDSAGRTPADFAAIMGEMDIMDYVIRQGGRCKLDNKPNMRALGRKRAKAREENGR